MQRTWAARVGAAETNRGGAVSKVFAWNSYLAFGVDFEERPRLRANVLGRNVEFGRSGSSRKTRLSQNMDTFRNREFQTVRKDRRAFLKDIAVYGGVLALGAYTGKFGNAAVDAASPDNWSNQIGIQLTVVRDETAKDFDAALAKLAEIGYKAVEPVGFSGIDPSKYRAMLDSHGLIAPSIDQGFSTGADIERDLEACQTLGCKFAEPGMSGGGRVADGARGSPGAGGVPGARGRGRGPVAPQTEESVKQIAADYNRYGQAAKKFGIKVFFHNHVEHFELLEGSQTTLFDLFLSETDPDTVAMELDLGNTAIAGRDISDVVKKYPGRFPVWDVNDAFGIKNADADASATPNRRRLYTYAVPVGLGEVDLKTCFASAAVAGLTYAVVTQSNASTWGDSLAVARVSYGNMMKMRT
jgi:sugar phosphate isomerase/epimerase